MAQVRRPSEDDESYLTHNEAARRARMSAATLFDRIRQGDGPRRIKIGGKVLYRVVDIDG
jgi:predicted DNA-binding transcriptional regulator AlpA